MTEIHKLLVKMGACNDAVVWADKWAASGTHLTAWEACNRSDWMLWLLARTTLDQDDPRLRLMACDFAEAVLHLVPNGEDRPRKAIEAARAFCAGTITREESAAASAPAWAAASAAAWAASSAAASAAAWAASSAAASAPASAAASAPAWAAARDDQAKTIRKHFPKCPPIKPDFL